MKRLVPCLFFALALVQCKARVSSAKLASNDEASSPAVLAEQVKKTCSGAPRFVEVTADGHVRYRAVTPAKRKIQPPDFDEGVATAASGHWALDLEFGNSPDIPLCVRHRTSLDMREFLAALGCIKSDVCSSAPKVATFVKSPGIVAYVDPSTSSKLSQPSLGKEQPRQEAIALAGNTPNFHPTIRYKTDGCEDPASFYHSIKKAPDGSLKCRQDTLYTWGSTKKTRYLADYLTNNSNRPFFFRPSSPTDRTYASPYPGWDWSPIFATLNPEATFGYGTELVRIKLKPDVQFVLVDKERASAGQSLGAPHLLCSQLTPAQAMNTVIVRYFQYPVAVAAQDTQTGKVGPTRTGQLSALDWILCGPGPIDSISYNRKENLFELFAQFARFDCAMEFLPNSWFQWVELYRKFNGEDILTGLAMDQGTDWDMAALDRNIKALVTAIHAGTGRVVLNPTGSRSEADHFKTAYPIYFNPAPPDDVPTLAQLDSENEKERDEPVKADKCVPYMK